MKFVIAAVLLGVLAALGSAGVFMMRRPQPGEAPNRRMARALAVRVGLSIALFAFIWIAYALGWIHPSGLQ